MEIVSGINYGWWWVLRIRSGFSANPDTDLDPASYLNADPDTDPGSKTNADPDPDPCRHKKFDFDMTIYFM